jgi:hypothetical protein
MSWKDRLRPGIVLVSPGGASFTAKWRGDDITIEKRVSRHAHPDQDFETAQDLGLQSPDFPLTFYFDGSDHDLIARRFAECMAERGGWTVNHPVYGTRRLQPVKITVKAHPAESGNVTEISGDWFEPADPGEAPPDAASAVEAACAGLAKAAQKDVERAAELVKKHAALRAAAKTFKDGYKSVKQLVHTANKRITGIIGTINDLSNQAALEIASLSGAVIQLMESPGLVLDNCASRVSTFVSLGKRIITDLPAAAAFSLNKIAAALSGELWLSAIAAGMGPRRYCNSTPLWSGIWSGRCTTSPPSGALSLTGPEARSRFARQNYAPMPGTLTICTASFVNGTACTDGGFCCLTRGTRW